jgi:hypothetical protein
MTERRRIRRESRTRAIVVDYISARTRRRATYRVRAATVAAAVRAWRRGHRGAVYLGAREP